MVKQVKLVLSVTLLVVLSSVSGCYYDNEEYLYGNVPCDATTVTYTLTVVPILSTSCYSCHATATGNASGGGIILDTYAKLMPYVTNGKLVGSITHAGGYSPMPKGATKLNNCDIQKIQAWITSGAPEN